MKHLINKLQRILGNTSPVAPVVFDVVWCTDRPGVEILLGTTTGKEADKLKARLALNGTSVPPSGQRPRENGQLALAWDEIPPMTREGERAQFSFRSKVVKPASTRMSPFSPAPPPAPVTGYLEGFDQAGNVYGWLDTTERSPEEFLLRCGEVSTPVHAEILRQDVAEAGFPGGRGFLVEFREFLPLFPPLFSGHALRVEGASGALLGQPVYWPVLEATRRNELLWHWLARFFALQLEGAAAGTDTLELFDAEFAKLEQTGLPGLQEEAGAARCVQLMQDFCGQQVGGQGEFRTNLRKLSELGTRLAGSHPMWHNAAAGFQVAIIAEDFLGAVRRSWRRQAFLATAEEESAPPAPPEAQFLAPALHSGRLHFLPWDGWVRKSLVGAIELAANLPATGGQDPDLAAKLSAAEAAVSLLYGDEQIIAGLQRLRRQLGLFSDHPSAHLRREALALKRQSKFLQALSAESADPEHETPSGRIAAFASQLGAACELGQLLAPAVIRDWKKQLDPSLAKAMTDPIFLTAWRGYLEFAGSALMNPSTTAGRTIGQARRTRTDIVHSLNELLEFEPVGAAARPPKRPGEALNILLVGAKDLPQVHLYRQEQKLAALRSLSGRRRPIHVEHADTWDQINDPKLTRRLAGCDILVVCRLPATLAVLRLIHTARRAGLRIIYEIDDLIFDHEHFPPAYETYARSITPREHRRLAEDTPLWLEAMRLADEIVVSTTTLADRIRALLGDGCPVHIEPNCQPQALRDRALSARTLRRWQKSEAVRLVYGTGTKAHKQIIDEWILPVLESLLEKYPQLEVTLVGRLKGMPPALTNHPRVTVAPFVDYESYLDILSTADVSLAAIESGPATDAKSGLKWMEAAVLGAASVVSPSATYREFLQDGVDALFASTKQEWEEQLARLIDDPALRARIATSARHKAMAQFSASTPKAVWASILEAKPEGAAQDVRPLRLLLVNLYYAPQAEGGATRVVEDQIRELQAKYPGRYEVTVLCSDRFAHDGGVEIHHQDGARVVRFKSLPKEWSAYTDDDIRSFLHDWFKKEHFDLIHVHALQVLTASVLKAAAAAGTPYVISIHDAWWLSRYQFLTSPSGRAIEPGDWLDETGLSPQSLRSARPGSQSRNLRQHLDKVLYTLHRNSRAQSEASASGDFRTRERLQSKRRDLDKELEALIPDQATRIRVYSAYVRRHDLLDILQGAAARFAVSPSFARIYAEAGVDNVEALGNSWQVYRPAPPQAADAPLECAFIGGWSLHKGAGVLLEACRLIHNAGPIHLRIVDHALTNHEHRDVRWGEIDVRFIAPVPLGEMETFYRSIDVLIAPSIWPESFGLVTREALSAGVWVIAADSGALAEPVQDGINGNVIAPRDVRALAESLRHAASAEGREALHRWREDARSGKGLATPPDNAETLHRIYTAAARIS